MASFSSGKMTYGLQATATPTSTNVSGTQTVGIAPTVWSITATTYCCFSWKAVAATTSNSVAFNLLDGTVVALAGTPVISDGDGLDCEGVSLTPLTALRAILLKTGSSNVQNVEIECADPMLNFGALGPGCVHMLGDMSNSLGVDATTMTFKLHAASDSVEVVAMYSA